MKGKTLAHIMINGLFEVFIFSLAKNKNHKIILHFYYNVNDLKSQDRFIFLQYCFYFLKLLYHYQEFNLTRDVYALKQVSPSQVEAPLHSFAVFRGPLHSFAVFRGP